MLSVIVPTHESERILVRTLACLVPGATAGLVGDVILADGGSTDETAQIGDVAGCRFLEMPGPLGPRLGAAVDAAKGQWLLFIQAGAVLDSGWVAEVQPFIDRAPAEMAAIFTPAAPLSAQGSVLQAILALLRARRTSLSPGRGLLISKSLYRALGGYRDCAGTEADLLRRIGKRRLAILRTSIVVPALS